MIAPAAEMMLLGRPKVQFLRFQMSVNTLAYTRHKGAVAPTLQCRVYALIQSVDASGSLGRRASELLTSAEHRVRLMTEIRNAPEFPGTEAVGVAVVTRTSRSSPFRCKGVFIDHVVRNTF